jgi:hypothetical protein
MRMEPTRKCSNYADVEKFGVSEHLNGEFGLSNGSFGPSSADFGPLATRALAQQLDNSS